MSTITVGTYNTLRTLDREAFAKDIFALTHTNVDLLGLQEARGHARYEVLGGIGGWHVYQPRINVNSSQDPILWRGSVFEYVDHGTELVSRGRAPYYPSRYANWVELRHRSTERHVFLLNSHANSHIEKAGHPRRTLSRTKRAEEHFAALVNIARYLGTQGEVFVTGDLNVDYRADRRVQYPRFPYVTLRNAHLIPCWSWANGVTGGTHGARRIDYVYHRRSSNIEPRAVRILRDGYRSDHKPVLATYTIV